MAGAGAAPIDGARLNRRVLVAAGAPSVCAVQRNVCSRSCQLGLWAGVDQHGVARWRWRRQRAIGAHAWGAVPAAGAPEHAACAAASAFAAARGGCRVWRRDMRRVWRYDARCGGTMRVWRCDALVQGAGNAERLLALGKCVQGVAHTQVRCSARMQHRGGSQRSMYVGGCVRAAAPAAAAAEAVAAC
eukprot:364927-Chlamydomonas_euryale.AAC.4